MQFCTAHPRKSVEQLQVSWQSAQWRTRHIHVCTVTQRDSVNVKNAVVRPVQYVTKYAAGHPVPQIRRILLPNVVTQCTRVTCTNVWVSQLLCSAKVYIAFTKKTNTWIWQKFRQKKSGVHVCTKCCDVTICSVQIISVLTATSHGKAEGTSGRHCPANRAVVDVTVFRIIWGDFSVSKKEKKTYK